MSRLLPAFVVAVVAVVVVPVAVRSQSPATPAAVDYEKDVKPLLAQNCYSCHGPDVQQAGLRLDLRQNALRGGDYGPVIIAGKGHESRLIKRLVDGDGGMQMPPSGALAPDQIALLRRWIDEGAEFRTEIGEEAPPPPVDPNLAAVVTAARSQPRAMVEQLVAAQPDLVTARDSAGATALHHAAGFGSAETVAFLLDAGSDINAKNRRGATPLHWAIHDEAKVRLLVSRGAAVNVKQNEGRTPLYQAAALGNGLSIVRFLLERGADPAIATANGQTPLMAAAARGDVEAIELLLGRTANVNAVNGAGETALMLAATSGNTKAVAALLARGADVRMKTKRSETALGNAATTGNEEVVRMLLDRGAEVNVRNIRGFSPLMLAASSDTIPAGVVKLLLAKGADTTYTADYDENARDLAAKRGDTPVARLLGGARKPAPAPAPMTSRASARPDLIPDAVDRAMRLLEKQSHNFIRISGCTSCHSQDLPSAAAAFARGRGLPAPREIPQLPMRMVAPPDRVIDFNIVALAGPVWELFDHGMNRDPRTPLTDALARYVKAMQMPDGRWSAIESRRPPMAAGDHQMTALAIFALKHYAPAGDDASAAQAIARGAAWLDRSKPETTQDRTFHLLGLSWAGTGGERLKRAARDLAATQRADGGWSQLPTMESDAYATGQVLYALTTAGDVPPGDQLYRRGVDYLLRTQAADGSWQVKSRSIWLQPYFESGFPYGQDQFISAAGTAWASMALAAAATPTTIAH